MIEWSENEICNLFSDWVTQKHKENWGFFV